MTRIKEKRISNIEEPKFRQEWADEYKKINLIMKILYDKKKKVEAEIMRLKVICSMRLGLGSYVHLR